MQCLPLSDQASTTLTENVVRYQSDTKNQTLHKILHAQTQRLLYELPSFLHLLDEEDCCEFLFFCYDTIDYYLNTYKIGRLSYIGYLTQVVRKRTRYFIAQQKTKSKKEKLLIESEHYQQHLNQEVEEVAEDATYTTFNALNLAQTTQLPYLFNQLLHERISPASVCSPKLEKLKAQLQTLVNRKRFLIVLTLSPDLANQYLLEDLCALLDVQFSLLNTYLNTATQILQEKQACREEFAEISNRHFRRLLEIEKQLQSEPDLEKQVKLMTLRKWTVHVYKAKVEKIRGMELNLSHSQLGELLDIPKGTIDSAVHYMKRLLKQYMDETKDNEYL